MSEKVEKEIISISVGEKTWMPPKDSPDVRGSFLKALGEANRKVEMEGGESSITVKVRDAATAKMYQADFIVDHLSELEDVFSKSSIPQEFSSIIDQIRPEERAPEKPRKEGMSWVHMGIKEGDTLMGWVTACVVPENRHVNKVSFSFCNAKDCFSRRIGRILSRERMDNGECIALVAGSDRYTDVREFLIHHAAGKTSPNFLSSTDDRLVDKWPMWLHPDRARRGDIPADVKEFLEDLKANSKDHIARRLSGRLLLRDRLPEYKTWPIRE